MTTTVHQLFTQDMTFYNHIIALSKLSCPRLDITRSKDLLMAGEQRW